MKVKGEMNRDLKVPVLDPPPISLAIHQFEDGLTLMRPWPPAWNVLSGRGWRLDALILELPCQYVVLASDIVIIRSQTAKGHVGGGLGRAMGLTFDAEGSQSS
jgi:hypothetical protein